MEFKCTICGTTYTQDFDFKKMFGFDPCIVCMGKEHGTIEELKQFSTLIEMKED